MIEKRSSITGRGGRKRVNQEKELQVPTEVAIL
jgi:hypothetical protein